MEPKITSPLEKAILEAIEEHQQEQAASQKPPMATKIRIGTHPNALNADNKNESQS